jgi:hypothetical protein
MAVERPFGILKGRWKILLKKIDFPLANIGDLWKYYSNLSMEKSEVDESGAGKRKK